MSLVIEFKEYCEKMNVVIPKKANITIKRVFSISNLVRGSICIPHTRRAVEYREELNTN